MTGFDGLLLGECCMPKLTSAKNDAAQIGLNVIQMIDDHQNGKCTNVYDIVVPFMSIIVNRVVVSRSNSAI